MKREADLAASELADRIAAWITSAGADLSVESVLKARSQAIAGMTDAERTLLETRLALMLGNDGRKGN